eukprot:3273648-Pyramimonas_sp.AAC.1
MGFRCLCSYASAAAASGDGSLTGAGVYGDAGVGREPPRAHGDHQGHAGVQPREVRVGRALPPGRDADVRPGWAAAVRHLRRGHHHHGQHGAAVLPVRLQPAAAHREPVRDQPPRQPQRGDRARH